MIRRMLGALELAMVFLAAGCSPAPELQGAAIASPPSSSPIARPTDIPSATAPLAAEATATIRTTDAPQSALALESTAFDNGDVIPARFSCDGKNISPELTWGPTPDGTLSFALIMEDPDAPGGTFIHWVIFNVPPDSTGLPEGVSKDAELADGSRQGTNSGRALGYTGPCPPGQTHRYFFKLFALDEALDLAPGATADELTSAMNGHILDQAELMGTYTRS
jgi:Raf kinase inhibitor-like YbhB/YbcL family protein